MKKIDGASLLARLLGVVSGRSRAFHRPKPQPFDPIAALVRIAERDGIEAAGQAARTYREVMHDDH